MAKLKSKNKALNFKQRIQRWWSLKCKFSKENDKCPMVMGKEIV